MSPRQAKHVKLTIDSDDRDQKPGESSSKKDLSKNFSLQTKHKKNLGIMGHEQPRMTRKRMPSV